MKPLLFALTILGTAASAQISPVSGPTAPLRKSHTVSVSVQSGAPVYQIEGQTDPGAIALTAGGTLAVRTGSGVQALVVVLDSGQIRGTDGNNAAVASSSASATLRARPPRDRREAVTSSTHTLLVLACTQSVATGACTEWQAARPAEGAPAAEGIRLTVHDQFSTQTLAAPDPPVEPID